MASTPKPTNDQLLDTFVEKALAGNLTAKELGQLADIFYEMKKARLAADKVADGLKKIEVQASSLALDQMIKQEISAVGGKLLQLAVGDPQDVPSVKDWPKLHAYIKKTGNFQLLERRPSVAAFRELWDDGKVVPGVDKFPVVKLKESKV